MPSVPGSGASDLCSTGSRPDDVIHCDTVSRAKPSRRCANCSRRNSCSCGASTTSSRPPGRPTRCFVNRACPVVEEVQHLVQNDDIEASLPSGRSYRSPAARCSSSGPRVRAGRAQAAACRATDRSQPTLDLRTEQFEHSSSTGAEIKQGAKRLVAERCTDRIFYGIIGHVQLADSVPLRSMRTKIGLRRGARVARTEASRARSRAMVWSAGFR